MCYLHKKLNATLYSVHKVVTRHWGCDHLSTGSSQAHLASLCLNLL